MVSHKVTSVPAFTVPKSIISKTKSSCTSFEQGANGVPVSVNVTSPSSPIDGV